MNTTLTGKINNDLNIRASLFFNKKLQKSNATAYRNEISTKEVSFIGFEPIISSTFSTSSHQIFLSVCKS